MSRSAPARLDCCRPWLKWDGPPKFFVWSHSLHYCERSPGVPLTEEELDRAVPRGAYPIHEQDQDEARRLADWGCSACGVTQLPHTEDCPTNPFSGQEYARGEVP